MRIGGQQSGLVNGFHRLLLLLLIQTRLETMSDLDRERLRCRELERRLQDEISHRNELVEQQVKKREKLKFQVTGR